MKRELQEKLFSKYPKIFIQKKLSMTETAMCWGIECGDGWYWLIDMLCNQIQYDIDKNNEPQIEAVQVKEKFGGLRFYTDITTDRQRGMIALAENMSYSICEDCGTTKDVTQNTEEYIQSLCIECRSKSK